MNKKIKVLICGVLPPPYFGHSMLYQMLMRSSFIESFDVSFLNMHFWSYETDKKVTGIKLLKLVRYFCQYLWRLAGHRPKYVLYNISFYKMPFLKDFLFCAAGILSGHEVVIHDHGRYVRELYDALPRWQGGLLRWMLKHASASIIMGEGVRASYEGLMAQEKLFVVPGTVYDSRPIKVEPNRPPGAIRNILFFSHMSRSKGINVAFAAAAIVLKADGGTCFTFAGPIENDEVALGLKTLQAQYPSRVRYMGYIQDEAARTALFRGADVFLFPTLRDVFGLVLLHAMAEGVAIVASREGTIPEIVLEGENGFLCEKGRAEEVSGKILQLLRDEPLRAKMGKANRARFDEKYCLPIYGRAMIDCFQKIK